MSLRFIIGPSGSGKTAFVTKELAHRASSHPQERFFCIVPDQFTMEMQKAMVLESPGHAIMNIEVLSFGRLTHRIFEEMGEPELTYLDDTGKNLIVEKIIREHGGELKTFGASSMSPAMIHEIKSAISEFMLYCVSGDKIDMLIRAAEDKQRPLLAKKLSDLKIIYGYFLDETEGKFTTIEGRVGLLKSMIPKSELLRDAEIIFDGFTGFTPVQAEVIAELLLKCRRVSFTLIGERKAMEETDIVPHELFALSKRTMALVRRLADETNVGEEDIVWAKETGLGSDRPRGQMCPDIEIVSCRTPRDEASFVGRRILALTRTKGFAYRDIAVVCADMDTYGDVMERELARRGVPCFTDRPGRLSVNPAAELVMSALSCIDSDFSLQETTEYFRNIFGPLEEDEYDFLEGFAASRSVRGAARWKKPFFGRNPGGENEEWNRAEELRQKVMKSLSSFDGRKHSVPEFTQMIREFLADNDIESRIASKAQELREAGRDDKADELSQVYSYMDSVLDVLGNLSGDDAVALGVFRKMLGAALKEIRIGTIPRREDRVLVGDLERTRLSHIKVLFLIGANDGNIPRAANKGGIISDLDRQLLSDAAPDIELAPSPRELMYRQRLYLYMCIMKPSEQLCVTYAQQDASGKERQPSYLVGALREHFGGVSVNMDTDSPDGYMELSDGLGLLAAGLRSFAADLPPEDRDTPGVLAALFDLCSRDKALSGLLERMTDGAFYSIKKDNLDAKLAGELYGRDIRGSVSRIQTFAACPYQYFLRYGMKLREDPGPEADARLGGDLLHRILCAFGERLLAEGMGWDEPDPAERAKILADVIAEVEKDPEFEPYFATGRSRYQEKYMTRVARRSVDVLSEQLSSGEFKPLRFEEKHTIHIPLKDGRKMVLNEVVDRVDMYADDEKDGGRYIKIIDYKTGNEDFSFSDTAIGKKLQLPVYLKTVMDGEKAGPGAMLYYHAADPMIEVKEDLADEDIFEKRKAELSPRGLVNNDEKVLGAMDREYADKKESAALPPESGRLSREALLEICEYSIDLCSALAEDIASGDISALPYEGKTTSEHPCGYCPYIGTCRAGEVGELELRKRPKIKNAAELIEYIESRKSR